MGPPANTPAVCFKCNKGRAVTASRDGRKKPYCEACFLKYVDTGIRDAFFRLCGVPTDVPVVLAVSGGPGSMALLDVAARIRSENLSRGGAGRIVYDLRVLHVNEGKCCTARGAADAEAVAHCDAVAAAVRAAAAERELECTELPMDGLVDADVLARAHGRAPLTDREDLYALLRRNSILNAATALGAKAVVFGESATTSAWRALGEIVRGRGAHVRTFHGFHGLLVVGPERELFLYRPVRGILAKEAALYCRAKGIAATYTPGIATGTAQRSIDRTLEAFVATLEVTYRSTVFNVLNSVDRIGPQADRAALARGSSTVTREDGGKRALKQHLHEVITGMLRGSIAGFFGRSQATAAAGTPATAPSAEGARESTQCGVCGAPAKRAVRTEASEAAADAACACRGCEVIATLGAPAVPSSAPVGQALGSKALDDILAAAAANAAGSSAAA